MPITAELVSASTGLTMTELLTYLRNFGWNIMDDSATQMIRDIINDSLRALALEHPWPWYKTRAKLKVRVLQETTGEVTEDSATVTLDDVDLDAEGWCLRKVGDEIYYPIKADAAGTLTLHETYLGTTDAAADLELHDLIHILPDDFRRLKEPVQGEYLYQMRLIDEDQLLALHRTGATPGTLQYYTVTSALNTSSERKMAIFVWPSPTVQTLLEFWYWRYPAYIDDDNAAVDWPKEHVHVLHTLMRMGYHRYQHDSGSAEAEFRQFRSEVQTLKRADTPKSERSMQRQPMETAEGGRRRSGDDAPYIPVTIVSQ